MARRVVYHDYRTLLEGEYVKIFNQAETYAWIMPLDDEAISTRMADLAELLLTAQRENQPIERVIGTDRKAFCIHYFEDIPRSNTWHIVLRTITSMAVLGLALSGFIYLLNDCPPQGTVNVAFYLILAAFWLLSELCSSMVFLPIFFRRMAQGKKPRPGLNTLIHIAYPAGTFVLSGVIARSVQLFVPTLPFLGVVLCIVVARKIIDICRTRSARKQDIQSKDNEAEIQHLEEEVFLDVKEYETLKTLISIHHARNERLEKKGKMPVTRAQYMEKLKKEDSHALRTHGIVCAIVAIICLIIFVFFSDFTGTMDMIFCVIFMLAAVLGCFWWMTWKPTATTPMQRRILKKCDALEVDIFEYEELLRAGETGEGDGSQD